MLQFGRAVLNTEYTAPDGRIFKIRAGQSILTEKNLHHNKPDVMVQIMAPVKKTILFEVSVPHLQNYHVQEGIKRAKYCRNSVEDINHRNYKTINRDMNLVTELETKHRCQVELGVLVVGCFGEIIQTPEHRNFRRLLGELGATERDADGLMRRVAYSVATDTSRILVGFMRRT